jgi:hypothetical protein
MARFLGVRKLFLCKAYANAKMALARFLPAPKWRMQSPCPSFIDAGMVPAVARCVPNLLQMQELGHVAKYL